MRTGGKQGEQTEHAGTYYIEVNSEDNKLFCKEYIYEINYYRFNWHKTVEIMVIMKGRAEVCAGGQTYHLCQDDILIINSNVGHGSFAGEEETIAFVFQLDPAYFETIFPAFETIYFTSEYLEERKYGNVCVAVRYYMARLMLLIHENSSGYMKEDIGIAMLLICKVLRFVPYELNGGSKQSRGEKSRKVIQKVLKYTEKHYKDKIVLDDLAKVTGYNRTYLSTIFKKTVGLNYYDYLTMLRIRHTLAELNHSERTITDIALDYGFPNVNSFTEAFKKNFKQSPNEYRNRLRGESKLKKYLPNRKDISVGHPYVEQKLKEFMSSIYISGDGEGSKGGTERESGKIGLDGEIRKLINMLYMKINKGE